MPKFLETRLKQEYPKNPGAVYGTLNKIGAMKGNKETPKGAAMQAKHYAKISRGPKLPIANKMPKTMAALGTYGMKKK